MKFVIKWSVVVTLSLFIFSCDDRQIDINCAKIIAYGKTEKERDFSDFFEIDKIIKLDSKEGFLLGHAKYYSGQKNIVINNGLRNEDILVFNKENGAIVSKFNQFGKGPNEYFYVQSINILKNDSIIEIGTSNKSQFIQFDQNGIVKKSKRIPIRYWSEADYINDHVLCLYSSQGFSQKNMFKYATYDFHNQELKFSLQADDRHFISYSGLNNFQRSNDSLFLIEPISNLIYSITEKGVTERYYIDYGDDAIPESFLNNKYKDVLQFHKKLIRTSYAYHHGKIYITNNHIIIESHKKDSKYLVIYDKNTGKSRNIESFNLKLPLSNVKKKFYPKIVHCSEEFIYISIEPEEIAKYYSVGLTNVGEFEPVASDFSNLKSSIAKTKTYDNPFLLKCSLKKID